jgi:hypothetical protein
MTPKERIAKLNLDMKELERETAQFKTETRFRLKQLRRELIRRRAALAKFHRAICRATDVAERAVEREPSQMNNLRLETLDDRLSGWQYDMEEFEEDIERSFVI